VSLPLGTKFTELFTITQDQIHVLIKGFECANESTRILQHDPDSKVDVLQHLVILTNRHFDVWLLKLTTIRISLNLKVLLENSAENF
jgi:hypothetical protein